jgi:hypothetical protein
MCHPNTLVNFQQMFLETIHGHKGFFILFFGQKDRIHYEKEGTQISEQDQDKPNPNHNTTKNTIQESSIF